MGKFKLPKSIEKMLTSVSVPLEESIKTRQSNEAVKNNFLQVAIRIDMIMERVYELSTSEFKDPDQNRKAFKFLMELFVMLLSNTILIFCIAATGWVTLNKLDKLQEKVLNGFLKTLNAAGKKIANKYGTF